MKTILISTLLVCLCLSAQAAEVSGLKIIECTASHNGDNIDLNLLLDCDHLAISSNEQLELQPILVQGKDTLWLPSLTLTGNIREKVNHRLASLGKPTTSGYADYNTKQLSESGQSKITYSRQFPFQEWMYGSRLILKSTVSGCADCQRELEDTTVSYIPRKMAVSYIMPQPEQKIRHKNVSIFLNFHQGKSDILPNFMNNLTELAKIDKLITELTTDSYINVDSITIIGYASPEGKYDYNTRLSGKRAMSLKRYLESRYTPQRYSINTIAASEDWEGLRKEIADKDFPYRAQILFTIDSISNPDARDIYIRKLDGGVAYNDLLRNYYPLLRRVVCDAGYLVQPFTTEQAKERLYTHPEQLSLNEMYLIAQSYPVGSPQFNELFVEMLTLFPDNDIARNNLAAVAIASGDFARAKSCLESVRHSPAIQNNLGILYFREGKVNEAKHCFEKASAAGCKEATHNLQEINILLATR